MHQLTLIDKAFLLKITPLFSQMELDLLLPIAEKLMLLQYEKNSKVFSIGEEGHRLYFVVEGEVALVDENNNEKYLITPNDFFGEEAVLSENPRRYSAICRTNTVLLGLSRTNILTILAECPQVAVVLLQYYTSTTPIRHRQKTP